MSTDKRDRIQACLEAEIKRLCAIIKVPPYGVPNFTYLEGPSGCLSVRPDGTLFQGYFERGELLSERETRDCDEFLYWIFVDAASYTAYTRARDRPLGGGPTERELAHQESLLHALNPRWAERRRRERLGGRHEHQDDRPAPEAPSAPAGGDAPA
ncbi:Imm63 family immunity protein [Kitasatospora sp. NPDC059327]|uniref:Imm63 family immunity protein n=1 Tax=Kitasatospora sp. NPDC059327 TaxID=3346803 RepID=UPI0036CBB0E2